MDNSPSVITIRSDNRASFVGTTGSGKSTIARELARQVDRLVCIDPKDELGGDEEWGLEESSKDAWKRLKNDQPARIRVPLPVSANPLEFLDSIFELCYTYGWMTVYLDEAFACVGKGGNPSPFLLALYTRGRSRAIGTWAATQRPARIPLVMLSESEWSFMFRLRLEVDRKRMSEFMGPAVLGGIPESDPFGFWMFHSSWREPQYKSGLQL